MSKHKFITLILNLIALNILQMILLKATLLNLKNYVKTKKRNTEKLKFL